MPFVTVRDFSALATCYAELNGEYRPAAAVYRIRFNALA